jgi:hypothetical protein
MMIIFSKLADAGLFLFLIIVLAYIAGAAVVVTVLALPVLLAAASGEYVKRWSKSHREIVRDELDSSSAQTFKDQIDEDLNYYCTDTNEIIC